ncbi:MAG: hypothetical protein WAN82_02440 [Candidatus Bathyarchaeia archaeon]
MSGKDEKKKDEPKFKEIAKGKVYNVGFPDRNFTWIDLRSEEQKKVALSAKDLGVEYNKGGKFDQLILVSDGYFHGAKPYEVFQEVERMKAIVTNRSGSADVAVMSSNLITLDMSKCKKCGTPLFLVGEDFKCPKCGEPTT